MLMTDIKLLVKYISFRLETKIIYYYICVMFIRIYMKHNAFQHAIVIYFILSKQIFTNQIYLTNEIIINGSLVNLI